MPAWLQDMTWPEIATYLESDDRVLMPYGATEQHGRFAPVGTDAYVATTLAEDASAQSGVVVAPTMWFGWSPHHLACPGTISLRAETLIEVFSDSVRSLAMHGFRCFVIINGHRVANLPWMQIAAERAQRELGVVVELFDPAFMSRELPSEQEFGEFGHADDIEISHMLYRYPELVDLDAATDHSPQHPPFHHRDPRDTRDTLAYVPATRVAMQGLIDETGDAIIGTPTRSSANKGKAYHDHLVGRILEVLEALES